MFQHAIIVSFGVRPASHSCLGILVESERVVNLLPELGIGLSLPLDRAIGYYVPDEREPIRIPLCIGFDMFYGE